MAVELISLLEILYTYFESNKRDMFWKKLWVGVEKHSDSYCKKSFSNLYELLISGTKSILIDLNV